MQKRPISSVRGTESLINIEWTVKTADLVGALEKSSIFFSRKSTYIVAKSLFVETTRRIQLGPSGTRNPLRGSLRDRRRLRPLNPHSIALSRGVQERSHNGEAAVPTTTTTITVTITIATVGRRLNVVTGLCRRV